MATSTRRTVVERLALVALLVLSAVLAFHRVSDADTFWHLAAGREILETGSVPTADRWTALALGRPWLDVYWLAQAGMALLERAGGLVLLQLAAVAGTWVALLAALAAGREGRASGVAWPLALVALFAALPRLQPRPDLASLAFPPIAVLLLGAIGAPEILPRRRALALIGLAALEVLWVNCHGSFVLGPLATLAYLAGAAVSRPGTYRLPPLLAGLGLQLAASVANPHGPRAWVFLAPFAGAVAVRLGFVPSGAAAAPMLEEWLPTFSPAARPFLLQAAWTYGALLAAAALALGCALWRRRLAGAAVLVLFAVLSATALRNIAPFAFVALATVPPLVAGARASRAPRFLPDILAAATALAAATFVYAVGSNRWYVSHLVAEEVGPGLRRSAFPEGACGFVAAAGLSGQAFNNHAMGGYFIWRFDRGRRAFLDPRIDALAPDQHQRYGEAMADPAAFEALLAEYAVTHIVLDYNAADAGTIVRYLEREARGWRRAFADGTGAVYVPSAAAPLPAVTPQARAVHPWDVAAARLFAPIARRQASLAVETVSLAELHTIAGEFALAAGGYEAAIRALPDVAGLHVRLGLARLRLGETVAARTELDWLERHAPREPGVATLRNELAGN